MRQDSPVVVVGAGVAGLAAARRLRMAGIEVILIEAGSRIGGRAFTVMTEGWAFDHGASWLHAAHRNPLVPLTDPAELSASDERDEHVFIGGRPADLAERAAYHAAWDRIGAVTAPALAAGPDCSLADAMAPMRDDPWAPTVAAWEGAIIAAADADVLSARDWHCNSLEGANLLVRGGLGAFIARRLQTAVRLNTPAIAIDWDHAGGVQVDTPQGPIDAAACIVTVSTGVLAAGTIRFRPALPAWLQEAVARLPMGLLSKVALRGGMGFAPEARLVPQMEQGSAGMVFIARPDGTDRMLGFAGGRAAWAVAPDPRAAVAMAQDGLRSMLGRAPSGDGAVVTDWGTNPLFRGSYAYALPGQAGMRAVLADAFLAERLLFAGEATRTDGLAGTVGGAYLSGIDAAERLLPQVVPGGRGLS